MGKEFRFFTRPLSLLYIITTALMLALQNKLAQYKIDLVVAVSANLILFMVTRFNIYFQMKNLRNPNPNAVIRGVMAATFLKLFVLGAAVIIYLLAAGKDRSINAVFLGMGLYIIYTWLEVKISLRLNPKK
jgi:hypothetical protein